MVSFSQIWNFLAHSTPELTFFQTCGFHRMLRNIISFILNCLYNKLLTQFCTIVQKPWFGAILDQFYQILGNQFFFSKDLVMSVLITYQYLTSYKKQRSKTFTALYRWGHIYHHLHRRTGVYDVNTHFRPQGPEELKQENKNYEQKYKLQ